MKNGVEIPPPDRLQPPSDFERQANRMKGVTGFVTILYAESDPRPLVYSRYYHVRRVVWLSLFIARKEGVISSESLSKIGRLAWGHDLNRWPFAHNSELGLFDQAGDIPSYFCREKIDTSSAEVGNLVGIVNKDHTSLDSEGRIVLLADIITGFLEDPIWLMCTLDVSPEIIPSQIAEFLGFHYKKQEFFTKLYSLFRVFNTAFELNAFLASFDCLFTEVADSFLKNHPEITSEAIGGESFQKIRAEVKEGFMRELIFPINNLGVSRGKFIQTELMVPLHLRLLESSTVDCLTSITDRECLDLALNFDLFPVSWRKRFYPDISYFSREGGGRRFVDYVEKTKTR